MRRLWLVMLVGALVGALCMPAASADSTDWVAGQVYRGDFPDPTMLVTHRSYVIASTRIAGLNLPIQTSKNLKTWRPRQPLPDALGAKGSWKYYDEALLRPPSWAATTGTRARPASATTRLISQWAPSLAKVGDHYVAAYSAARHVGDMNNRHSCIGLAVSRKAIGPYKPVSGHPVVCFPKSPYGVIDPDIFVDPHTHAVYLLWKRENVPGVSIQRIVARRLNRHGTGFARHSHAHVMLRPGVRGPHGHVRINWEQNVTENPSMVYVHHKYLLFYSGNDWETSHYAVGYAVCHGPLGPCTKRSRKHPLLCSRGHIAGPGGEDAFVDHHGKLKMVYAAWVKGHVANGSVGRRVHVATIRMRHDKLRVVRASY